jgi:hypothetical protein
MVSQLPAKQFTNLEHRGIIHNQIAKGVAREHKNSYGIDKTCGFVRCRERS